MLRILAALILLQTLYFKFTAHPQSVELFTKLGMEPWGRIGTGIFELIASILILYPRTTGIGAILGVGLMAGAIFFHITILGIDFGGDYVLFIYAVITFICCAILSLIYRKQVFKLIGIKSLKMLMNKKFLILTVMLAGFVSGFAQQKKLPVYNQFVDLAATAGKDQGAVAASYVYNWRLGQKRKFEIGIGGRFTSYFGTKKDFLTAPAKLARTTTFPFVIVFAGQQEKNIDTLTVQRPQTNSVNVTANLGYHLSSRWYAGFNIDVIGFTFGKKTNAVLTSNGVTVTEPVAKPAAFNVLLTGDNDHGSLNSEFFLKYDLNNRWSVRGVYQFLFAEYKTTTVKQIAPDGTINDRFRNKANNFGVGVSYKIK